MFRTIIDAFKNKEMRRKIIITLLLLLVFRIGCWLPIPGISKTAFVDAASDQNGFLGLLSTLSGGALANASILALGVSPYINASIIIQLLQAAIPKLEEIAQSGEDGKKKINLYTRIAALVLAVTQAIGITFTLSGSDLFDTRFWGTWTNVAPVFTVIVLVAGAMFTVWLGERITENGVGNGLSLLIFTGILSTAGAGILESITNISANLDYLWNLLLFLGVAVFIFGFIVFIDGSERKIPVQYAKQVKGRKTYGGQSNCIPVRVNGSGVMPIIFATQLLMFPYMLITMFWPNSAEGYNAVMGNGTWLNISLTAVLILFFSYFYAQMTFKPDDISKNLQHSGGFINGIRPGKDTATYLNKVSKRITLLGALFLAFIAFVPSALFSLVGGDLTVLTSSFSATGMMIIVSVALEFQRSLETQMISRSYKGFLD